MVELPCAGGVVLKLYPDGTRRMLGWNSQWIRQRYFDGEEWHWESPVWVTEWRVPPVTRERYA